MLFTEAVRLFVLDRAQNVKPATVEFYKSRLASFLTKFGARELATLTGGEIHIHLSEIGEKLTPSTRRHNIVAWEQIQSFCVEREFLPAPITKPIKKPRMGRREIFCTPAQTKKLLANASPAFRDIYETLAICAARPGELCRAQVENLQRSEHGAVIVLRDHKTATKTGIARQIPIGKKLLEKLDTLIGDRKTGHIFHSATGKPWTVENLSRTFRGLRVKAGLPSELVLYCARHEAITRFQEKTGDLAATQKMAGHSSPTMTANYTHRNVDHIAQMMDTLDEPEPAELEEKSDSASQAGGASPGPPGS